MSRPYTQPYDGLLDERLGGGGYRNQQEALGKKRREKKDARKGLLDVKVTANQNLRFQRGAGGGETGRIPPTLSYMSQRKRFATRQREGLSTTRKNELKVKSAQLLWKKGGAYYR